MINPMRTFVFSLALAFSSSAAISEPSPELVPSTPNINATGYLLIDADSGKVLAEQNANERLPPASLTKMMTSYIIRKEISEGDISLSDPVPISVNAWKMKGSKMFIREGTQVAVEDLLKGIIIQSGNDASVAMAEYIGGSEEAFADLMNQMARHLGMDGTNYLNSTGWPAEGHYTTARDLATLAKHTISDHPELYPIYKEKYFEYNGINQPNRNKLLWRDKSVDGIKTGHTEAAGYCLVSSAKRGDMRLISVILGTKSEEARARETQKLLSFGFRNFETHKLYGTKEALNESDVWSGLQDKVELGVTEDIFVTIPRGKHDALEAKIDVDRVIKAPFQAGDEFGVVSVIVEGEVLMEKPLVALQGVEQAGIVSRIGDQVSLFFLKLFNRI